ncbi:MAG: hypothetical protein AB7P01_16395 [Bacteroidia bacterium]
MDQRNPLYNGPASDDELEVNKWREEFYKLIVHEMQTEERFVNYFKGFSSRSVEQFINSYAFSKVHWYLAGHRKKPTKENRILNNVLWCIDAIQQKKLFDLQCRWRANELKIPGIDIAMAFTSLEDNISEVNNLFAIGYADIELFKRYLADKPLHLHYNTSLPWQYHKAIKAWYLEPEPSRGNQYAESWYDYHNRYTGNNKLMHLPDERGAKEEFYIALAEAEETKNKPPVQQPPSLPAVNLNDKKLIEFIASTFDSKESYKRFKEKEEFNKPFQRKKNLIIEEDINLLSEAKRKIPIDEDDDWRAAVKRAAEHYRRQLLCEALDEYAEDFFHEAEDNPHPEYFLDIRVENERKKILRGRELNNEPPDLNF